MNEIEIVSDYLGWELRKSIRKKLWKENIKKFYQKDWIRFKITINE